MLVNHVEVAGTHYLPDEVSQQCVIIEQQAKQGFASVYSYITLHHNCACS